MRRNRQRGGQLSLSLLLRDHFSEGPVTAVRTPNFKPWQWTTLTVLMLALDGLLGVCVVLSLMTFGPGAGRADTLAEAGAPSKPAPTLRPTFTPTATPEVWPTATPTRTPTRMPPATPTWTPLPT